MRALAGNKYAQAAAIALATGVIAALTVYFGTMTDGLDTRHTVKDVGLAFIGPFAVLVSVLPKITDILTPSVLLVAAPNTQISADAPLVAATGDETVVTHGALTTVQVRPRTGDGRFAPIAESGGGDILVAEPPRVDPP